MDKNNKKMIDFAEYEKIISVNISKLTPHPKNEKLLPRLTKGELNRLKDRIKKYGFVEPIEITKSGTVLDGNNRVFKILIPNKTELEDAGVKVDKIPARIIDIPESDEENYIISKNFDRRQLSKLMQSYIRGQQYNEMKKKQGGTGANQYNKDEQSAKNYQSAKTSQIIANRFDIAESTVRNDGRFKKLCDELIVLTSYDFVFNLLNGEIKANKSVIQNLHKLPNTLIENVFIYYRESKDFELKPLKKVIDEIEKNKELDTHDEHTEWKKEYIKIKSEYDVLISNLAKQKNIDKDDLINEALKMYIESNK